MLDFSRTTILFGGSFDPIHQGHLHVAKYALASLPGAQLAFVPANQSPAKHPPQASAEQRLRWLTLATGPGPFQVWEVELRRKGPSFTVDTLMSAHSEGATREKLFWLLGADAYEHFEKWREPARIRSLARLMVVNRPGSETKTSPEDDLFISIPPHPASSTQIRASLATNSTDNPELPSPVAADLDALIMSGKNPYRPR